MFKFLKDKLRKTVEKFSKKVEEESDTKEVEEPVKEQEEPRTEARESEEIDVEKIEKELKETVPEEGLEETPAEQETKQIEIETPSQKPLYGEEEEKKGIFDKIKKTITTKTLSADKFNELFFDMEVTLLENNVAMEVIEKIKNDLRRELVNKPIPRKDIMERILQSLKNSLTELFDVKTFDLVSKVKDKKPTIISFVGINGSGKTTTIAKIANLLKKSGMKPIIAASDTFRAASIEQLEEHTKRLDLKIIKHDYGSDPAAVAFDAVNYAKAKGFDAVLIDTAGRLHNNKNLMDEIKKITRVSKPDMNIFVGESLTGNDCVEQAKKFDDAVGIDGIILTKADVDEKGGASISVSYVTRKPIIYIGVGQEYDDLEPFDSKKLIEKLGI